MPSIPGNSKIPSGLEINMDGGGEFIRSGYEEFIKQVPPADGIISKDLYKQVFTFLKNFMGRVTTEIPVIKESRCPAVNSPENLQKWMSRPQKIENGVNAADKSLDIFNEILEKSNSQGSNLLKRLFGKDHIQSRFYTELIIGRISLLTNGWSNIENDAGSAAIELFKAALKHDPDLVIEYSIKCAKNKSAKPAKNKLQGLKEAVAPNSGGEMDKKAKMTRKYKGKRAAKTGEKKMPAKRGGGSAKGEIDGARGKLTEGRERMNLDRIGPRRARIPEVKIKF